MFPAFLQTSLDRARWLSVHARELPRGLLGDADPEAHCPYSELRLLQSWSGFDSVQTITHLALPALPQRLPRWLRRRPSIKPFVKPLLSPLLRPSAVYRYHDAPYHHDSMFEHDPTPDQAWFFLNGIGADRRVLMLNAAYLSELFGRPLTLLHNPGCGLIADLAEVSFRRDSVRLEQAARSAFAPVYAALKQPQCRRVVLLAHGQGTIVASVLLWLFRMLYKPTAGALLGGKVQWPTPRCPEQRVARRLGRAWKFPSAESVELRAQVPGAETIRPPLSREELGKLELYGFANCAGSMEPVDRELPFIESYANEHDPIARLLASGRDGQPRICGERYLRPDTWGHLLNAHYLHPMEREWLASSPRAALRTALIGLPGNRLETPRLFGYFGGASPPAWGGTDHAVERVRLERLHRMEPPRVKRPPAAHDAEPLPANAMPIPPWLASEDAGSAPQSPISGLAA